MIVRIVVPWWVPLVRGLVSLAIGLAVLLWPDKSAYVVVMLLGLFAVATGIIGAFASLGAHQLGWGTSLTASLVTIGVGMVAWLAPDFTVRVFVYLVAGWAFLFGLLQLAAAGALRGLGAAEALARGLGIVSVAFALLLFIRPGIGVVGASLLVALYLITTGGVLVHNALMVRALGGPGATFP